MTERRRATSSATLPDLTTCDQEPIHIPSLIQPHGVLLAMDEPDLIIRQVSTNSKIVIGVAPEALLGQPLSAVLAAEEIDQIRTALAHEHLEANPLYLFTVKLRGKRRALDGIAHRYQGVLTLELEPARRSGINAYHAIRAVAGRLQHAATIASFTAVIVQEVRRLTGFDRVMVYQFAPDGHGIVIAEDKRADLGAFLGLHYPASDIPQQARQLYTLNWLRLIADCVYTPVPLLPPTNPLTSKALDMSYSVLRSVSPVHLEYLANMGVTASMSISIVRDGQLWGLIACHQYAGPKFIPYDLRTACEIIGQMVSLQLPAKEAQRDAEYIAQMATRQQRLIAAMAEEQEVIDGLTLHEPTLLDLFDVEGAAVWWDGACRLLGQTPDTDQVRRLVEWLSKGPAREDVLATDELSARFTDAVAYRAVASGLLAVTLSRSPGQYLLFFRPEAAQTVRWAGDPEKPVEVTETGVRLSPRRSFAAWQQEVQGHSVPWQRFEISAARDLRTTLIRGVLRRAEELTRLNAELAESNAELDAFAYIASHDLKEPLRGMHNYAQFLIEDYRDQLDDAGQEKLHTLVRLTQRMEELINSLLYFSRVGRVDLAIGETNLGAVVDEVLDLLHLRLEQTGVTVRIPQPLPVVWCDKVRVAEVYNNLITNAMKYNDHAEKWIELGVRAEPERLVLYVRDNGIGIPAQHHETIFRIFKRLHERDAFGGGTGAGLTITRKIIERHGGEMWVESIPGEGATFFFTLERAHK